MNTGSLLSMDWVASMTLDVRGAVRRFLATPARSAAIVAVLGLAIGITAATFTILDALFLRPVPFTAPETLAIVHMRGKIGGPKAVPPSLIGAWRRSSAFENIEAARVDTVIVGTDPDVTKRTVASVTPGMFALLGGVRPLRGRLFGPDDLRSGNAVLISESLWRTFFHADPEVIGHGVNVDGASMTVVGVLPSTFHFPTARTTIWRVADFANADSPVTFPVAYVRFGQNMPKADALSMATASAREVSSQYAAQSAEALPLATGDDDTRETLPFFIGGVALAFLALCANASSLLLVGIAARSREFETRLALGASRGRLIRQALIDSAVACTVAVAVGLWIASGLVSVAQSILPAALLQQTLSAMRLDARAVAATSLAAIAALMCAGVLPAAVGTRVQAGMSSRLATRGGTETIRTRTTRRGLLVAQIAVSCTLLLGATWLIRSFVNLESRDRGIDASGVLVATVEFPLDRLATKEARATVAAEMAAQARTLPGVRATSWSYGVPPAGGIRPSGAWASDMPGAAPVQMEVRQFLIDDQFLAFYSLPILRGRSFQPSDGADALLVSERFARLIWPDGDAVDRSVTLNDKKRFHVIGVVKEIRYPSLDARLDAPQIYGTVLDIGVLSFLNIRCAPSCPDSAFVERRLAGLGATVETVRPLEGWYTAQLVGPRVAAMLALAFAITALVAAAAGLFSLMSHSVTRRRREFGIRMALGASPSAIRRLVVREGLIVTVPGAVLGLGAGLLLVRLLSSLLFEVSPADPLSAMVGSIVLGLTLVLASWRPLQVAVAAVPSAMLRED